MFHPSQIKPVNLTAGFGRLVIEMFPVDVEAHEEKMAPTLLTLPEGIEQLPAPEAHDTAYDHFYAAPKKQTIIRPANSVPMYRRGVVVAINDGMVNGGEIVNIGHMINTGMIVVVPNNALTQAVLTQEDMWQKDEKGELVERILFIIHQDQVLAYYEP